MTYIHTKVVAGNGAGGTCFRFGRVRASLRRCGFFCNEFPRAAREQGRARVSKYRPIHGETVTQPQTDGQNESADEGAIDLRWQFN